MSGADGAAVVRRRGDLIALLAGLAVLGAAVWTAHVTGLSDQERWVFRQVNELPDALSRPAQWANLLGTPWTVALVLVAFTVLQRWRAVLDVALTWILVRWATHTAKVWIGRDRPSGFLFDAILRGPMPTGFGIPSGHTSTAAAIATAAAPHVPPRVRWLLWAAVALVAVCRMYVGAHLPLDVVAGAALGVAVGSAVHLALGVPAPAREPIAADAGRLSG